MTDLAHRNDLTERKRIVTELIDALFSRGELDAVDRYTTEDFVNHNPNPGLSGDREGFRQTAAMMRSAFPDWHSHLHLLVAEGDMVVERFTARGTHQAEMMGVPPTGREVVLHGINIFRFHGDRIAERWGQLDNLGFLQQLGVVPAMA